MFNKEATGVESQIVITTDWFTRKQTAQYLQCGLSTLDTSIPIKNIF